MIKLSIIIPIYNVEKYLRRCLDSVITAVEFLPRENVEIVCVDDGSTDGGGRIVDEYAAKDKRFVVVHQKNRGLSETRNVGLEHSHGEWIGWVDSDDWVEPDHFKNLCEYAFNHDVDMVSCDVIKDYEDGRKEVTDQYCGSDNATVILDAILRRKILAAVWNRLYRRSFIDKIGAHCAERAKSPLMEDSYFNSTFLLGYPKVAHVGKATYHYFLRAGSLSIQADKTKWWMNACVSNSTIYDLLNGKFNAETLRWRIGLFRSWMVLEPNVTDAMFYGFHPEVKWLSSDICGLKNRLLFYLASCGLRGMLLKLMNWKRGVAK